MTTSKPSDSGFELDRIRPESIELPATVPVDITFTLTTI